MPDTPVMSNSLIEINKKKGGEFTKHVIDKQRAEQSQFHTRLGRGDMTGRAGDAQNQVSLESISKGTRTKSSKIITRRDKEKEGVDNFHAGNIHKSKKNFKKDSVTAAQGAQDIRLKLQEAKNTAYQKDHALYDASKLGKKDQDVLQETTEAKEALQTQLSTPAAPGAAPDPDRASKEFAVAQLTEKENLLKTKVAMERKLRLGKSYQATLKTKKKEVARIRKELGAIDKQKMKLEGEEAGSFKNRALRFIGLKDKTEGRNAKMVAYLRRADELRAQLPALNKEIEELENKKKFHEMLKELMDGKNASDMKQLGNAESEAVLEQYKEQLLAEAAQDPNPDPAAMETALETFMEQQAAQRGELEGAVEQGATYNKNKELMAQKETEKADTTSQLSQLVNAQAAHTDVIRGMRAGANVDDSMTDEAAVAKFTALAEAANKKLTGEGETGGLLAALQKANKDLGEAQRELIAVQRVISSTQRVGNANAAVLAKKDAASKKVQELAKIRDQRSAEVQEQRNIMKKLDDYNKALADKKAIEDKIVSMNDAIVAKQGEINAIKTANDTIAGGNEAGYLETLAAKQKELDELNQQVASKRQLIRDVQQARAQREQMYKTRIDQVDMVLGASKEVRNFKENGFQAGMTHVTKEGGLTDSARYHHDQSKLYRGKLDDQEKVLKEQEKGYQNARNSKENKQYLEQKHKMQALDALGSVSEDSDMVKLLKNSPCIKIGENTVIIFRGLLLSKDGIVDPESLNASDQQMAQKEIEKEKIVRGIENSPAMQFLFAENLEDYTKYDENSGAFEGQNEVTKEEIEQAMKGFKDKLFGFMDDHMSEDSNGGQIKATIDEVLEAISDFSNFEEGKKATDLDKYIKGLKEKQYAWNPLGDAKDGFDKGMAGLGYLNVLIGGLQTIKSFMDGEGKVGKDKILAWLGGMNGLMETAKTAFDATTTFSKGLNKFQEDTKFSSYLNAGAGLFNLGVHAIEGYNALEDAKDQGNIFRERDAKRDTISNMVDDAGQIAGGFGGDTGQFIANTAVNGKDLILNSYRAEEARKRSNDQQMLGLTMSRSGADQTGHGSRITQVAANKSKQDQVEYAEAATEAVLKIAADMLGAFVPVVGKYVALAVKVGVATLGRAAKMLSKCIIEHKEAKSLLSAPNVLGKVKYDKKLVPEAEFNEILRETVGIRDLGHVYKALKITDAIDLHSGMKLVETGTRVTAVDQVAGALGYRDPAKYKNVTLETIMGDMGYQSGVGNWRESLKHCYDGTHESQKNIFQRGWSWVHSKMHTGYAASVSDKEKIEIADRNRKIMQNTPGAATPSA